MEAQGKKLSDSPLAYTLGQAEWFALLRQTKGKDTIVRYRADGQKWHLFSVDTGKQVSKGDPIKDLYLLSPRAPIMLKNVRPWHFGPWV